MTPWAAVCPASLSFTTSQNLLKFMPIESEISGITYAVCIQGFLKTFFSLNYIFEICGFIFFYFIYIKDGVGMF